MIRWLLLLHRYLGIGVFALSWVLSGLLSMNPWGWLEGADSHMERARLQGGDMPGAQIKRALAALVRSQPSGVVSLKIAPLADRLYFIATAADGERRRLNAEADPAPLTGADLTHVARVLGGAAAAPTARLMTREDDYAERGLIWDIGG
jgi:hypothetical protein